MKIKPVKLLVSFLLVAALTGCSTPSTSSSNSEQSSNSQAPSITSSSASDTISSLTNSSESLNTSSESSTVISSNPSSDNSSISSSEIASSSSSSSTPTDAEGEYTLVTDIDDLKANDRVVITSFDSGSGYTMSKNPGTNNRPGVSAQAIDNKITVTESDNIASFVLKEGTSVNSYCFYDTVNNGYLAATSTSQNRLTLADSMIPSSCFTITFSDQVPSISSVGNTSRGNLRYNATSTIFSCYASGQKPVYLYVKESIPVYATAINVTPTQAEVGINDKVSLKVNYTPSNTNQKKVTWTSNNPSIASVSSSGEVTGLAAGTVRINATVNSATETLTSYCDVTVKVIPVSSLSFDKESYEIGIDGTKQLEVTVLPSNATNKNVTYSSSNPTVASVSATGLVTGLTKGETIITATSEDGGKQATMNISVTDISYTVLVYMAGNNLESDTSDGGGGAATEDISEMLKVDLPSNVNVVIETGGCKKWQNYNISNTKLGRHHVENKKLITDAEIASANMGLSSTLEDFLVYGMTNYPASKTSLILWDHGGAMGGVVFDELFGDDGLKNSEVTQAVGDAFTDMNRPLSNKLEWIGYDACVMAIADLAEFNSQYFNYMISSEESEWGFGWSYDSWLQTLADNPSVDTPILGKSICDSLISYTDKYDGGYYKSQNDQTMSIIDLSKMNQYKVAWEDFAIQVNSVSNSWTSIKSLANSSKRFGYADGYGYSFDIVDIKDFCDKVQASGSYGKFNKIDAVETAFNNIVAYSTKGQIAGNAYGLTFFCPTSGYSYKSDYSSSETNFTNWRNYVTTYGTW